MILSTSFRPKDKGERWGQRRRKSKRDSGDVRKWTEIQSERESESDSDSERERAREREREREREKLIHSHTRTQTEEVFSHDETNL